MNVPSLALALAPGHVFVTREKGNTHFYEPALHRRRVAGVDRMHLWPKPCTCALTGEFASGTSFVTFLFFEMHQESNQESNEKQTLFNGHPSETPPTSHADSRPNSWPKKTLTSPGAQGQQVATLHSHNRPERARRWQHRTHHSVDVMQKRVMGWGEDLVTCPGKASP